MTAAPPLFDRGDRAASPAPSRPVDAPKHSAGREGRPLMSSCVPGPSWSPASHVDDRRRILARPRPSTMTARGAALNGDVLWATMRVRFRAARQGGHRGG
jgi:hypothetical protein